LKRASARPPGSLRKQAGFLAYWYDFQTREVYVFGRLVLSNTDVGHALLNLDRDLWIDPATVAEGIHWVEEAIAEAWWEQQDDTTWHPATRASILELMGFEGPTEMGITAGDGDGDPGDPVPDCCRVWEPCCGMVSGIGPSHLSPPPPDLTAEGLITMTLATVQCCPGDDGGGGPWPPPPPCVCCVYAGAATASDEATCCHICCDNKCDDGNPCTENDECDFGECVGTPKDCDDGDPCTRDRCVNGACENMPCDGECCDDGRCCSGVGSTCCGDGCCYPGYTCVDPATGRCCPTGQTLCNGQCCIGPCCEGRCCRHAGWTCCGRWCCPPDTTCCNTDVGECCTADQTCCEGSCGRLGACCFFDTGSCTQKTEDCCFSQGGFYMGEDTVCLPDDLCRPVCENCQNVSLVFYEYAHYTEDPNELCSTTECFENRIDIATCEFFPSRLGPPKCNVQVSSTGIWAVQDVMELEDASCASYHDGPFHLLTTFYEGCRFCTPHPIMVRCDTFGCEGRWVRTYERRGARSCDCP